MNIFEKPNKLFDITDKVAIITGASGALGRMSAKLLAGAGAKLILAADKTNEIADECRQAGVDVRASWYRI